MTNHFTSQALQRAATAGEGERVVGNLASIAGVVRMDVAQMGVTSVNVTSVNVTPVNVTPVNANGVVDSWVGMPCYFAELPGLGVNFGIQSQHKHCRWPQFLRDRLS